MQNIETYNREGAVNPAPSLEEKDNQSINIKNYLKFDPHTIEERIKLIEDTLINEAEELQELELKKLEAMLDELRRIKY